MLTDAQCRNATCPSDKPRARLADSGGLYLEVTPNGSKRWFWKYRKDGKEMRLALGNYPAVSLTVDADRKLSHWGCGRKLGLVKRRFPGFGDARQGCEHQGRL